jgi:hypothetical protein
MLDDGGMQLERIEGQVQAPVHPVIVAKPAATDGGCWAFAAPRRARA